jgi:DNA replication protein DnaD
MVKRTNNDLQNITQKTNDRATRWTKEQTTIYKTLHRKPTIEQHDGQKNKQRSTKHYTENQRSSNTMVKRANYDLQNITQKTNDRATQWSKEQTTIYKALHRKPTIEQNNGQKNKQRSTKHYTENQRSSNTMVKGTNNDLKNITQKTNDRATRWSKEQTTIYKTLHRKPTIEQHELH